MMTPQEQRAALLERAARRADIAATVALAAESIAKHESDAAALRTLAAAFQNADVEVRCEQWPPVDARTNDLHEVPIVRITIAIPTEAP